MVNMTSLLNRSNGLSTLNLSPTPLNKCVILVDPFMIQICLGATPTQLISCRVRIGLKDYVKNVITSSITGFDGPLTPISYVVLPFHNQLLTTTITYLPFLLFFVFAFFIQKRWGGAGLYGQVIEVSGVLVSLNPERCGCNSFWVGDLTLLIKDLLLYYKVTMYK